MLWARQKNHLNALSKKTLKKVIFFNEFFIFLNVPEHTCSYCIFISSFALFIPWAMSTTELIPSWTAAIRNKINYKVYDLVRWNTQYDMLVNPMMAGIAGNSPQLNKQVLLDLVYSNSRWLINLSPSSSKHKYPWLPVKNQLKINSS